MASKQSYTVQGATVTLDSAFDASLEKPSLTTSHAVHVHLVFSIYPALFSSQHLSPSKITLLILSFVIPLFGMWAWRQPTT